MIATMERNPAWADIDPSIISKNQQVRAGENNSIKNGSFPLSSGQVSIAKYYDGEVGCPELVLVEPSRRLSSSRASTPPTTSTAIVAPSGGEGRGIRRGRFAHKEPEVLPRDNLALAHPTLSVGEFEQRGKGKHDEKEHDKKRRGGLRGEGGEGR